MNEYDIGDRVRLAMSTPFSANDTPFDPDVVNIIVRLPDGTLTTYVFGTDPEVVRNSAGDYEMELSVESSGVYRYVFEGVASDGENQGADENAFIARRRRTTT